MNKLLINFIALWVLSGTLASAQTLPPAAVAPNT